jgi:hypothetical protein
LAFSPSPEHPHSLTSLPHLHRKIVFRVLERLLVVPQQMLD